MAVNRALRHAHEPSPRLEHTSSQTPAKKPKKKGTSRGKLFLYIVISFAIGFFLVSRHVEIQDTGVELRVAREELARVENINQQLQLQIDRSMDLAAIEQTAIEQFGMRRVERHQMFYIDMNTTNFGERIYQSNNRVSVEDGILHGVPGILIRAIETLN